MRAEYMDYFVSYKRIMSFSIFEITPTGYFTPLLYLCYPQTFNSCICNIALVDSSWIRYLRTEMDYGGYSYGGWSGASGEKARWDRGNTVRVKTKNAQGVHIHRQVFLFSSRWLKEKKEKTDSWQPNAIPLTPFRKHFKSCFGFCMDQWVLLQCLPRCYD